MTVLDYLITCHWDQQKNSRQSSQNPQTTHKRKQTKTPTKLILQFQIICQMHITLT